MKLSEQSLEKRSERFSELFLGIFKLLYNLFDLLGMESLEVFFSRCKFKMLRLLVAFDNLDRNFKFVPVLRVTPIYALIIE